MTVARSWRRSAASRSQNVELTTVEMTAKPSGFEYRKRRTVCCSTSILKKFIEKKYPFCEHTVLLFYYYISKIKLNTHRN